MGIFDSTVVTTKVLSKRLLEIDKYKPSSKIAMELWIQESFGKFYDKPDLVEYLLEGNKKSLSTMWNKLYRFTDKKHRYVFGRPVSYVTTNEESGIVQATQDYIKKTQGVETHSSWIAKADIYMQAWQQIINDFNYNSKDNTLVIQGEKGNLIDGYIKSTGALDIPNKGLAFSAIHLKNPNAVQSPAVQADTDAFCIVYEINGVQKSIDIQLNPIIYSNKVFAVYEKDGYKFFSYELGTGNTDIDTAVKLSDSFGQYYPRVYLRNNYIDTIESKDTLKRKHTKKALKYVNQDLKELTNSFKKAMGDNYNDVWGMYIHLGIDITTIHNSPLLTEYCFKYFDKLRTIIHDTERFTQVIADNQIQELLSVFLIDKTIEHTKITEIGTYKASKVDKLPVGNRYIHGFTMYYQKSIDECITLKLVINDSEVNVNGHLSVNELIIPIDKSLVNQFRKKDRDKIFYDSLRISILIYKETKKKWYETFAFQAGIFIVGALFTGGTLNAIAGSLIKQLVISTLANVALEIAVQKNVLTSQQAITLNILTTVISTGKSILNSPKLLNANNLFKVVNTSADIYQKSQAIKLEDIKQKANDFAKTSAQKQEQLQKVQKLLDTKVTDMSLEVLTRGYQSTILLGERPHDFYTRTLSYDIVPLSYSLITLYVANSLSLDNVSIKQHSADEPIEHYLLL